MIHYAPRKIKSDMLPNLCFFWIITDDIMPKLIPRAAIYNFYHSRCCSFCYLANSGCSYDFFMPLLTCKILLQTIKPKLEWPFSFNLLGVFSMLLFFQVAIARVLEPLEVNAHALLFGAEIAMHPIFTTQLCA